MSCEVLFFGGKIEHQPYHDLESLFYVFIWICMTYEGPQKPKSTRMFTDPGSPLYQWISGDSFMSTSETKRGQMIPSMWETGNSRLLHEFSDYFSDLKQCAISLNKAFFGNDEPRVTHQQVVSIFQTALDNLPANSVLEEFRQFSRKLRTERREDQQPSLLGAVGSKRRMDSDLAYAAVTQTMPSLAFHLGSTQTSGTDFTLSSMTGGSSSTEGLDVVTSPVPRPRTSSFGSYKRKYFADGSL